MAETSNRTNGETMDRVALAEREAALRQRELDALRIEAGVDDREYARLQLLSQLIATAVCEHAQEMLDETEVGGKGSPKARGTREPEKRRSGWI